MSDQAGTSGQEIASGELRAALQSCLDHTFGVPRPIATIERRVSDYRSSFALEELTVEFKCGQTLSIIFKSLGRKALAAGARQAKPEFLDDPLREIEVYRTILAREAWGTAVCYGTVVDEARDRYWLFLEKVPGVELNTVGDFAVWQHVARWLARMHVRGTVLLPSLGAAARQRLLRCDAAYFGCWIARAERFLRSDTPPDQAAAFQRLARRYDRVVEQLTALSATLIHGEFYASNILVVNAHRASLPARPGRRAEELLRIAPVDWELAAIAPGLIDLAALVSGNWPDERRRSLAQAYRQELAGIGQADCDFESMWTALSYCRLHLAIQQLGWSANWSPPPAHAHDWLAEAFQLADELRI